MATPAPPGPLVGNELARAIELLTDKQLRAYQYYREGHAWNWIAQRMGSSRTAVIHLVAKAQKRLGYELTVTPKQKSAYKSVSLRRAEQEAAYVRYLEELFAQMPPRDRRRLSRILNESSSDEERNRRLAVRLRELQRERRTQEIEDWGRAVGEDEGEFQASLAADFGLNPATGMPMRAEDFVVDDGKGYDRL